MHITIGCALPALLLLHAPAVVLAPAVKVMGSDPKLLLAQLNQISLSEDAPQESFNQQQAC